MSVMEDTQGSDREKFRHLSFTSTPLPIHVMRQANLDSNSVFTRANDP